MSGYEIAAIIGASALVPVGVGIGLSLIQFEFEWGDPPSDED